MRCFFICFCGLVLSSCATPRSNYDICSSYRAVDTPEYFDCVERLNEVDRRAMQNNMYLIQQLAPRQEVSRPRESTTCWRLPNGMVRCQAD
jgi:hypothetical protein